MFFEPFLILSAVQQGPLFCWRRPLPSGSDITLTAWVCNRCMNTRTPHYKYLAVMRWRNVFIPAVSSFNVVADWCMCMPQYYVYTIKLLFVPLSLFWCFSCVLLTSCFILEVIVLVPSCSFCVLHFFSFPAFYTCPLHLVFPLVTSMWSFFPLSLSDDDFYSWVFLSFMPFVSCTIQSSWFVICWCF